MVLSCKTLRFFANQLKSKEVNFVHKLFCAIVQNGAEIVQKL